MDASGPATDPASEERFARETVGVIDQSRRGRLRVSGKTATGFLQRLLTNDVRKLQDERGQPSCLLTGKGKLVAAFHLYRFGDEVYTLEFAEPLRAEAVQPLKKYAALEDVVVEESKKGGAFLVEGPRAGDLLRGWIEEGLPPEEPFREHIVFGRGMRCFVRQSGETPAGGWEIANPHPPLWRVLVERAEDLGGGPVRSAAAEVLRIEAGVPRWGVDFDGSNFPNECGWEEALDYDKGCYIGQEVIARMRTYGHLNKRLLRVRFEEAAEVPPGARLHRDGKEVGQVTSSAASFLGGGVWALAYLRQQAWEPGTVVQAGAAERPAAGEVLPLKSTGSRS